MQIDWAIVGGIGVNSVDIGILTQPWRETKQKMPVKRAYHGIGLIKKSVYVFGGRSAYKRPPSNATYAFDLTKRVSTDLIMM